MRKKKGVLLLIITVLVLFSPVMVRAETQSKETHIGIGFCVSQPMPHEPLMPMNNVLSTTEKMECFSRPDELKSLPSTGGKLQGLYLRLIGVICIIVCFWLFLFTLLREEEKYV